MIVGALRDCGQIASEPSDVKADVHVCRVVGRVLQGHEVDDETAIQLTRELYPPDPWKLDAPLWRLGQDYCGAAVPLCGECYLAERCEYRARARHGGISITSSWLLPLLKLMKSLMKL
jgi:endonuclease III